MLFQPTSHKVEKVLTYESCQHCNLYIFLYRDSLPVTKYERKYRDGCISQFCNIIMWTACGRPLFTDHDNRDGPFTVFAVQLESLIKLQLTPNIGRHCAKLEMSFRGLTTCTYRYWWEDQVVRIKRHKSFTGGTAATRSQLPINCILYQPRVYFRPCDLLLC